MFDRRAAPAGVERKRRRQPEGDRGQAPGAQRRDDDLGWPCGRRGECTRGGERAGDRDQALAALRRLVAERINQWGRGRGDGELRPALLGLRQDRAERHGVGPAAGGAAEYEGAEPFGPRVQRRVCGCLAGERVVGSFPQAAIADGMCLAELGDHGKSVALPWHHVARQQAEALATSAAGHQGELQHLPRRHPLPVNVAREHDDRPAHPRSREPECCPWQQAGQRAWGGMASCHFPSRAA